MKKILIAAAFVIAALSAMALTEITLPDLKDCAYGVPVGSLGLLSFGADREKTKEAIEKSIPSERGPCDYLVIFDGDRCYLLGQSFNDKEPNKITSINLILNKKGMTIAKAKEKILRWVELVERKYSIKMSQPSIRATDEKLEMDYKWYGDSSRDHEIIIRGKVDVDGNFRILLHSRIGHGCLPF